MRIASVTVGLYASKALVGARRLRVNNAEALRDYPLPAYTSLFHVLQEAKRLQPILASARIVLETNSTHALLAAACAGVGVAVLPRFVARRGVRTPSSTVGGARRRVEIYVSGLQRCPPRNASSKWSIRGPTGV